MNHPCLHTPRPPALNGAALRHGNGAVLVPRNPPVRSWQLVKEDRTREHARGSGEGQNPWVELQSRHLRKRQEVPTGIDTPAPLRGCLCRI